MAKRALTWKRAAAIGWRDLKSAPGKFGFVMLSVAVGVAALVGVRGLSDSFRTTLSGQARSLMAGDLSARILHPPTAEELSKVAAILKQGSAGAGSSGIRSTWVTETISMASVPPQPVPLLVSLKAVDPSEYPYYGTAELEPAMTLAQALEGDSAVVADEFLIRMNAKVGDTLRLGGRDFKIAAVLQQEPDRITSGAGLGPRVMISQAALARTGLVAPGSRVSERLLVKLPEKAPGGLSADAEAAAVRSELESALPDAQVMDFREGNPALTRGLDNATAILSLICLVAMVLGAIGVAMAMHAHLEQRMDMLAILKAVGAGSGDLLRIFLLQTLGLGLVGGVVGVVAGLGVMVALPAAFGNLVPIHVVLNFPWQSVLAGLGTGLLTTLLFCLPPLLDVRAVRPVLVLRRLVESGPEGFRGWVAKWWARRLQLAIAAIVVTALGGIAWALSDSAKVGSVFAAMFAIALVVLLALAAGALWLVRFLLDRVRLRLPSSLRHGLANLYRPGNQSAAVLAALGTGVMLILSVYLMQAQVLRELKETASPKLPNIFLVDVTKDEVAGVREFFEHQKGVQQQLDLMPVVPGRFVSINGQLVSEMKGKHYPRRMLENAELTWADAPLEGDTVTEGAWWKNGNAAELAVRDGVAQRLNLNVGSAVELEIGGVARTLKVSAIYRADGQHLGGRVEFVLPSGQLKDQPATWYGGVHMDPKQVATMERALFAAYPTITVINVADVLMRIESVVDQITFVVRLLAGFSILAGLTILASSIASTRFRRMQEAVVLKTLGATRMRIVRTFSVEFSVLGLLAGAVGVVFANLLTRVLLHRLEVAFHIEWGATAIALVGTAVLATATGWIASYRILGLRPLQVLREE
ncbi:MAG TPA: FtsX-like permease family protein [Terracidiphilus sp.]|nr:FtsX-like permease family protein [Terracidiphilus sp.]